MMTFDRVLPELIRVCREHVASEPGVARYCIVRDVRGRVRLVVEPTEVTVPELEALEMTLLATLGVPVRRKEWLDGIDSLKDRVADVLNESELAELGRRVDDACLFEAAGATGATSDDEDAP